MGIISGLLQVIDVYTAASNSSDGSVSHQIFGDGSRIRHLREGGDMGAKRIDKALRWLSAHWPTEAVWPAGVLRPLPASRQKPPQEEATA